MNEHIQQKVTYAAYAKDDNIRASSSSGGIFTLIAEYVLSLDGFVYGAAYDEKYNVKHIEVNSVKDLDLIRRAKYSQSSLKDIIPLIKLRLMSGHPVLFSGTPCQVAAIKKMYGKYYANLFTIDFVCHGVPLPSIWLKYIEYRSKIDNNGIPPTKINQRSKKTGWSKYTYSCEYDYINKNVTIFNYDDPYLKLFISNAINLKACSYCNFKGNHRFSDLTMGDYWGIWDQLPEFDDNKGVSVVTVWSDKGASIFDHIKSNLIQKKVSFENAYVCNPSMLRNSPAHPDRENIINDILNNGFESYIHKANLACKKKNSAIHQYIIRCRSFVRYLFRN